MVAVWLLGFAFGSPGYLSYYRTGFRRSLAERRAAG
jgi:hypothetical protein